MRSRAESCATPSPDRVTLPSGTVTFLFTDIEGSTSLWERSPDAMQDALVDHDAILLSATAAHAGTVFKTIGDAFCCAFARPQDAADAAIEAQRSLTAHAWPPEIGSLRVRMGIHTGSAIERDGDYFGPTVNRVARLLSIGYGGQILVSTASAALLEPLLRDGERLRDLGAHRLRDLTYAETTYQLDADGLRADFPALASLDARPNNLPSQISSFVGRDRELNELRTLLTEHRLVTVTGPGGIGKTRLALQLVAGVIDRYPDGAWFVDLSGVSDPELVAQTIAAVLGVVETRSERILETLIRDLTRKHLLLLIDNAEHLLTGVAGVAKEILTRCAGIEVVVTSREALHITGEGVYRLETMPAPPAHLRADELMEYDSTRLLLERARGIVRDLVVKDEDADVVSALCRKLEGIPLAIELAAARINTLSLRQLNERLSEPLPMLAAHDRTQDRHRTLQSTIDWSYRLLNEQEKGVFAALAVFFDGFTLDACERVAPQSQMPVLDILQSLADKSFVYFDTRGQEPRFRQLEMVRKFARLELEASKNAAEMERRHAQYFAEFVARGNITPQDEAPVWYRRLDDEVANVRAALDWCGTNDAPLGARLALDVAPYWRVRGTIAEARGRLTRLLALDLRDARAPVLCVAASFAAMQDDFATSLALAEDALELYRGIGDSAGVADATFRIAEAEHRKGSLDFAKALYEEAQSLFVPAGNARGEMLCIANLGMLARQQGDYARAKLLLQDALQRATKTGDRRIIGDFVIALAWSNVYLDDLSAAEDLFRKALAQKESEGDAYGVCSADHGLATVALKDGRLEDALALFDATVASARELQLHDYLFRGFDGISAVLALKGDVERAARYLGLAQRWFHESGRQLRDSIAHDMAIDRIAGALPEARWQSLMAEGERLESYGPI